MAALTLNTVAYNKHSQSGDVVVLKDYVSDKKVATFRRTAPVRVKDFPGMEKTFVKLSVTDDEGKLLGVLDVQTSVLVGSSAAATKTTITGFLDALASATEFTDLVTDQKLPYAIT